MKAIAGALIVLILWLVYVAVMSNLLADKLHDLKENLNINQTELNQAWDAMNQ